MLCGVHPSRDPGDPPSQTGLVITKVLAQSPPCARRPAAGATAELYKSKILNQAETMCKVVGDKERIWCKGTILPCTQEAQREDCSGFVDRLKKHPLPTLFPRELRRSC